MARQYRPGSRLAKYRPDGKMSENRYAWLRTVVGQFVIMKYDNVPDSVEEEDEYDHENGPTVRLVLPRHSGAPMRYNLTALTEEELRLTREFFNLLFDLAEPIVRERDRLAQDAFDAGDDSYARIYRQVPQLIVRERPSRTDGQGVRDGSASDDVRAGGDGDSSDGVRAGSEELADGHEKVRQAQDDDAPTD